MGEKISAGGVVRDHMKKWLVGFALNKGIGNVLEAELWGILEGLNLVWKAGYKKVIVESDSQTAVDLLTSDNYSLHPLFGIIHACISLIKKDWCCVIQFVYRECNKVADCLASLGHSMVLGTTVLTNPPPQISESLKSGFKGTAVARTFPSFQCCCFRLISLPMYPKKRINVFKVFN